MRILIAEDDTVARKILQRSVQKFGHECLAAEDGEKAWERFQSTPEVDVVISDWMTPGMDGLELCRRIKGEERDGYTFFIFLTALGGQLPAPAAQRAGGSTAEAQRGAVRRGATAVPSKTLIMRNDLGTCSHRIDPLRYIKVPGSRNIRQANLL